MSKLNFLKEPASKLKPKDLKGLNVEILPKMRKRIKNCKSIF